MIHIAFKSQLMCNSNVTTQTTKQISTKGSLTWWKSRSLFGGDPDRQRLWTRAQTTQSNKYNNLPRENNNNNKRKVYYRELQEDIVDVSSSQVHCTLRLLTPPPHHQPRPRPLPRPLAAHWPPPPILVQ